MFWYRECATSKHPDRRFLIEGTTNACGRVFEQLLRSGLISSFESIDDLCAKSASEGSRQPAIAFYPLGGTAAPHWRTDLPSIILEHTVGETPELVRAVTESVASFVIDDIDALHGLKSGTGDTITVSGGVSQIDFLLQFIADCTGKTLQRIVDQSYVTAQGAALAAMKGSGAIANVEELNRTLEIDTFEPQSSAALGRYQQWKQLRDSLLAGQAPKGGARSRAAIG